MNKSRKISCSVKIILKTSISSDFDPFMGSQLFLCMHKSQIWFIIVQWNHNQQFSSKPDHYFLISFISFHYFFSFSNFGHFRAIFYPSDPWDTQTFWLWNWIHPRSPWDVSQLKKTVSWQLFSVSIVQKPWYVHFHYFGASRGRALTWGIPRWPQVYPNEPKIVPNISPNKTTTFYF